MKTDRHAIITLPHPSLRVKSSKVKLFDADLKKLVVQMSDATIDWEKSREHEVGVALAAVQINVMQKVVVVRKDFDDKNNTEFDYFINPKIIAHSDETVEQLEGCLSVKNLYGRVPRYKKVKIQALTIDGEQIRFWAEDFTARIFQHEIDHTNGITYADRIGKSGDFLRIQPDDKMQPLTDEELQDIVNKYGLSDAKS